MEIEEKELYFSEDAPLRAWRLFRVGRLADIRPGSHRARTRSTPAETHEQRRGRPGCDGHVLYSPMYDDPDPTPWPAFKIAVCNEDHPAPSAGCRCGIYAAVHGTLDSLPGYLLDTSHDPNPWAYAEVGCSGRVFMDMRGVRAERVNILALHLADECWPDDATLGEVQLSVAKHYGVPVSGLGGVPTWVLGNERDQGPPPDEVKLDLDLARLDLPLGQ